MAADSVTRFDADGYYLPKDTLTVAGNQVNWLDLHTLDYYYGGQLHDLPQPVQPPDIRLVITKRNSSRDVQSQCSAARTQPDSLSITCAKTAIGDVAIDGHFLDRGPKYSDKFAGEATELLVARVVVTSDGKQIYDHVHRFVYTTGD